MNLNLIKFKFNYKQTKQQIETEMKFIGLPFLQKDKLYIIKIVLMESNNAIHYIHHVGYFETLKGKKIYYSVSNKKGIFIETTIEKIKFFIPEKGELEDPNYVAYSSITK